ncbi:MAG: hypothetical protein ACREF7_04695, partial [Candidatus Saccharimonadales bacterium]
VKTSLTIKGNKLTLVASNLEDQSYPISIDPSVLVTSAAGFGTGNNEGDVNIGSNLSVSGLTGATINSWTATTSFTATSMPGRSGLSAVAYNGYLYVMGGYSGTATGDCANYCNGTFYAPINSNGTIGSWTATTSFTTTSMPTRESFGAVAYNGYLYVMGGEAGAASGDCATSFCNGTFYAPINANGTIGSWTATTSFTATSMPGRYSFGAVAYNGYLYVMGGASNVSSGDCAANYCNGTFYAPINSNGTIGSWSATTSFTATSMPARDYFGAVAYNGYLYVIGGSSNAATGDCATDYCNGVFEAAINPAGYLGSSITNTYPLTNPQDDSAVMAYNGYVYVIAGCQNSTCPTGESYFAPINSNGSIGSWTTTTALPTATEFLSGAVYNGYVYAIGGETSGAINVVYYAEIDTSSGALDVNGTCGTPWCTTSTLTQNTEYASSVEYNGYIYEIGGYSGSTGYTTVEYTQIQSSGALGTWATTGSLLSATYYAAAAVYAGYIYEVGGGSGSASTVVEYAQIDSANGELDINGTCGTPWCNTTVLPAANYYLTVAADNGYLYELGGYSGSTVYNEIYYAVINNNGTLGSWVKTSNLKAATYKSGALAYNGYLYLVAGGNTSTKLSAVYYSYINNGGPGTISAWTATTSFTATSMPARYGFGAVAYNGYLYVMGGEDFYGPSDCTLSGDTTDFCNGTFYAPINANGTIGSWTATTSFPTASMPARSDFGAVAYNGYLYVMGGTTAVSAADCTVNGINGYFCNGTFYAPINANGTIGSWTATTSFPTASIPAR